MRDLTKTELGLNLLINMAIMAQYEWNEPVPTPVEFPVSHSIALNAVSSRMPPGYVTKTMMWTLREGFKLFHESGQYSSASLTTRLDGRLLGFTTIKSNLRNVPAVGAHSNLSSLIPFSSPRSSQLGRRGLVIRLDYVPNGAIFTEAGFFWDIMQLLLWAANHDPKTEAPSVTSGYSNAEDYTIELAPMGIESVYELPFSRIIEILAKLPEAMYVQRQAVGKWPVAELRGQIKLDGVNIGRIRILKGQLAGCGGSNETATA